MKVSNPFVMTPKKSNLKPPSLPEYSSSSDSEEASPVAKTSMRMMNSMSK